MSAALTLATPEHLDRLDALITACHQEIGISLAPEARRAGVLPLLEGSPHGVVYLIGPPRAPIGYVVITFGWSVEFGGLDGFVDEFYVRPGVRGRGIASETLQTLPRALAAAGLKALHLEVDRDADKTQRLYARAGFAARPKYMLMSRSF
ncbi:GNAT family N-acetyltransferase [Roseobacter sp. YSTF-M11]|uniref:GNAT family N-acetyltransferase n=1 Tax=Roseobacter insulae TaxID=2859783 RepID=A0A9X1JYE2_9RHOB|nr:GNAT family N-acetyltransferase [Roseobacter insulae]MBW4708075.1 GNAT family N-acetyltransferase [Roseobacter insulae]